MEIKRGVNVLPLHPEIAEYARRQQLMKKLVIFIFRGKDAVEVLDINNHYGP